MAPQRSDRGAEVNGVAKNCHTTKYERVKKKKCMAEKLNPFNGINAAQAHKHRQSTACTLASGMAVEWEGRPAE